MDLGHLGIVINHTRFTAGYLAEVFESTAAEVDIETKHNTMLEIDRYNRYYTQSQDFGIYKPASVT